ncbi:hypothetical protein BcFMB_01775 [Bifidobacterium choerinum]|uniref:Uncharacterized protein n=1 Tax=Bifidobacterium choerinum TaxID=35760 RepID=A0A2D3D360_9BIFI|nr:hypothetical protein BcFMB_01775 [Bifidobacterium choerinum]
MTEIDGFQLVITDEEAFKLGVVADIQGRQLIAAEIQIGQTGKVFDAGGGCDVSACVVVVAAAFDLPYAVQLVRAEYPIVIRILLLNQCTERRVGEVRGVEGDAGFCCDAGRAGDHHQRRCQCDAEGTSGDAR